MPPPLAAGGLGQNGVAELDLAIEGIHCAACLSKIEHALMAVAGVASARLNFTSHRAHVSFDPASTSEDQLIEALRRSGYRAKPYVPRDVEAAQSTRARDLLRRLSVAGFGATNIMLLSVAVWSGAGGEDAAETRDLFHWLSALIAIPVCVYAGRPFFASALGALRARRTNMDVPISIGVLLGLAMSLVETARHAEHAYFDSATTLLFFLLCGRYLDQAMRGKTRAVAGNLASLKAQQANRIEPNGQLTSIPAAALQVGDRALIRPGGRIPADGLVIEGGALVDESLLTGETAPRRASIGDRVYAGTLALDGAIMLRCAAASGDTLVDEIDRLIARACEVKSRRAMLADRVAGYYAPVVHVAAALTFAGWMIAGASAHDALVVAISVLIITCPCALGLAAPVVQVVAAGALFRAGVLLNSGDAIERLAEVDFVAFDKTGTLTLPEPRVVNSDETPRALLELAGRLALSSHHPMALAIAREAGAVEPFAAVREVAGEGVETLIEGVPARLGRPSFCGLDEDVEHGGSRDLSMIAFSFGARQARFLVRQRLRPDAVAVVGAIKQWGLEVVVLSGDRPEPTRDVSLAVGASECRGGLRPGDKIAALEAYAARGARVLMVGDGLNDAPALAAAHASMSPATATDLTQAKADAIFLGERLEPVRKALQISRLARRLTRQNLAMAIAYNVFAVPLAMFGHATPLVAAVAMSGSSIIVCLNALRARGDAETAWSGNVGAVAFGHNAIGAGA